MQSLFERGQRARTFRRDLPRQWLITTALSLMHATAEDSTAGRIKADDAALLAAFSPPGDSRDTPRPG